MILKIHELEAKSFLACFDSLLCPQLTGAAGVPDNMPGLCISATEMAVALVLAEVPVELLLSLPAAPPG